jgi:hypothetical protein
MRVRLVDIDSTIPNLALMKLSAWHKAQGDTVGLNLSDPDVTYGSCVFSWNSRKAEIVKGEVGGTGVDIKKVLPTEVEAMRPDYSLYAERFPTWRGVGLGFITRGCARKCAFCLVPPKEGSIRTVGNFSGLMNPDWQRDKHRRMYGPFIVLLDNNLLASPDAMDILGEIADTKWDVCFSQGLDIRLVTPEIANALSRVKFWNTKHSGQNLTFAFDDVRIESAFRRGVSTLLEAGIKAWHLQFFVLCGFNSTFEEDLYRIEVIRSLGAHPFAMVYRDPATGARDTKLRHFARWVNKRLYKVCPWDKYHGWAKMQGQGELFPADVQNQHEEM